MKKVRAFVLSVFAAVVFIAGVSVSSGESLPHGIINDQPSANWIVGTCIPKTQQARKPLRYRPCLD